MADLKARIGPKAAYFPNKTWVRPGLGVQHSPNQNTRLSESRELTFDQNSDSFSRDEYDQDELDDSHSPHSSLPSPNPPVKLNLLARMGITAIDEPEVSFSEGNGVPNLQKSLLDRVSDRRKDDETWTSPSAKRMSIGPGVDNAKPDIDQEKTSKQIKSPQVGQVPESNHSATANGSVTLADNMSLSPQQNGSVVRNEEQGHRRSPSRPLQNGSTSFNSRQAVAPLEPPSSQENSKSSLPIEEGKFTGSTSADQVRSAILPLMQQNAESRLKCDENKRNSLQNRTPDPRVLTDDICSSFAEDLLTFQRGAQAREILRDANSGQYQSVRGKEGCRPSSPSSASLAQRLSNLPEDRQPGQQMAQKSRISRFSDIVPPRIANNQVGGEPSQQSTSYVSNNSLSDIGPPSTSVNPNPEGTFHSSASFTDHGRQAKPPPSAPANVRKAEAHQSVQASSSYANPRLANDNPIPTTTSYIDHRNSQALPTHKSPTSPRRSFNTWTLFRGRLVREYHSPEPDKPAEHRSYGRQSPPSPTKYFQDRNYNRSPIPRRRSLDRDPNPEFRFRMSPSRRTERDDYYDRSRDLSREKGSSRRGHSREDSRKRQRSASFDRPRKSREVFTSRRRTPSPGPRRLRSRTPPPSSKFHRLSRRSRSPPRRPRSSERIERMDTPSERSVSTKASSSRMPSSSGDSHPPRSVQMDVDREEKGQAKFRILGSKHKCHQVPGFWFMIRGLDRQIATLKCEFTIDHETAVEWNIFPINNHTPHIATEQSSEASRKKLSLQLCCFSTQLFSDVVTKLDPDASDTDRANAIFALEQSWPEQGHLTIIVNPESRSQGIWLPRHLGPGTSPVQIEGNVQEGDNIIQFLQLSPMADYVFVLYATEIIHDSPLLLPFRTQDNTDIEFTPAIVTVSREI